jgi:hypothetical protein
MMKKLIILILLASIHFASGSSDNPIIYIPMARPIIKATERADIQFKLFASHLGRLESNNDWKVINTLGYMGKYQFGTATLDGLGYHNITPERFREDPSIFTEGMQEQALRDLVAYNKNCLKACEKYIGQIINGVMVTKAGMLAAAHLAGAGNVQRFLTNGHNATDMNGTSVTKYLNEFRQYSV